MSKNREKEKGGMCLGDTVVEAWGGYGLNCAPFPNSYVDVVTPSFSELDFSWKWGHF